VAARERELHVRQSTSEFFKRSLIIVCEQREQRVNSKQWVSKQQAVGHTAELARNSNESENNGLLPWRETTKR
jgi:hypothetical protein